MIEKIMDLPFVPVEGMDFALPYSVTARGEPNQEDWQWQWFRFTVNDVCINGVTGEVWVTLDPGKASVEEMKNIVDADPGWKVVSE